MQDYYAIKIQTSAENVETLSALLISNGFAEAVEEEESSIQLYSPSEEFKTEELEDFLKDISSSFGDVLTFSKELIKGKNWNQEWESSFQAISLAENRLRIRATFHEPDPSYPYEIVIDPKMAFGTGHHATTSLILNYLFTQDLKGVNLLDAGAGTGILAIMAQKLGAKDVWAYDYDPIAVENSIENFALNATGKVETFVGTIFEMPTQRTFQYILANINRNVLLQEIAEYVRYLSKSGTLVLSGFYVEDVPLLLAEASKAGLKLVSQDEKDRWTMLVFQAA